jgi:prevent-host-death family protein
MQLVNIYQAKTKLSSLVDQALEGDEVVIARSGKPLVRLVPYATSTMPRKPGLLKGKINVPDNFNDEIGQINDLFLTEES